MRQRLFQTICLGLAMLGGVALAGAQDAGPQAGGRANFGGMQRVTGEVTAVTAASISVKAEDGVTYQVVTTSNTRIMMGLGEGAQPQSVKATDLKAGDGVMAAGNMDAPNKTLHAVFVVGTSAEQVKKLRENLGKTYIAGRVTAIDVDNLKMTVKRADGVSQTIGFDDGTSFKRGGRGRGAGQGSAGFNMGGAGNAGQGGESITLADIKVGDNVAGQGAVKGGVFVPATLNVMAPRAPRSARADDPAAPPKP